MSGGWYDEGRHSEPERQDVAIKGVSDRTRQAVLEAASAAGLTVGEWVEQALARAAEGARNPRPPARRWREPPR